MTAIANGSWEFVERRLERAAKRASRNVTPAVPEEVIKDAVNDAVIVYRKKRSAGFTVGSSLGFAFKRVRHVAHDWHRSRRRQRTVSLPEDDLDGLPQVPKGNATSLRVCGEVREVQEAIREAMNGLHSVDRNIIQRHYLDGIPYSDIAAMFRDEAQVVSHAAGTKAGCGAMRIPTTEDAVRKRASRAMKEVREWLRLRGFEVPGSRSAGTPEPGRAHADRDANHAADAVCRPGRSNPEKKDPESGGQAP